MNLVGLIALIPKIMEAMALVNTVKTALASGQSILDVLKEKGADFIEFFTDVAKLLFPDLNAEQQVAAGVSMLDIQFVKETQTAMNRFQEVGLISFGAPLKVDGSYGPLTKAAVLVFQQKYFTDVKQHDGWAGQMTNAIIKVEQAKLVAPADMARALATAPK